MTPEQDEARIAAKALHDFRREHYREGPRWEDIDWGHQERWVLSMKAALEAIASQPVPAPDLVGRVARELAEPIMKEFDAWPLNEPVEWERVSRSDQEKLRALARAIIPIIQTEPHGLCARCSGVIVPVDWEQQLRDVRADERETCAKVAEATKCEYLFNAGEPEREMRSRIAAAIRERSGG